ncbi:Asp23/Gls24 family envelope stress response protein [Geodermatophilus sp. TF02-6]|uniref:Asp23/Gls24 family envelope stress response protein n=1 Tax=Geodermatophilus sp. TF02-6 TaxID=2250575 RepID=UPI000DEB7C07|nr:Asp23/Gls24 family envelope stress response protein [Geodermatophilus sp. TF02-6]RBY77599.1 Asp23/Gls24 family envelope stress response protein [Geodermatophilus sp. TF02-6]
MSTALSTSADAPTGALQPADVGTAFPELGDPADRGGLVVADRVVDRVAGYAVTRVEGASAAPRRLLGVNVGDARSTTEASVDARVDGSTATVDASIAVSWPASVRAVTDRVRRQIRQDVRHLTGIRIDHIDIDVVSMSSPAARPRRVR